jgi:hypothetical protein
MAEPASDAQHPEDEFVLLGRAPNAGMALVWGSLLETSGILSLIPGAHLMDEWATVRSGIFRDVANEVYVPLSRLEEARRVIEQSPVPPDFEQQALEAESPETETGE